MAQAGAEGIALYIQHLEAQAAGDWAAAERLLRAAADLGEPMALHALAFQQTRVDAAVSLYTAAADAGFAASAWNLYLHFGDIGDRDAAQTWLERAAELGDADAIGLVKRRPG